MDTPSLQPEPFAAVAYNPVPNSENLIHGDEVARRHGFRGGLVPGVVVSAYLLDPALRAYGRAALFDADGTRCAEGSFALAREPSQVPEFDARMVRAPRSAERPRACREVL